MRVGGGSYNASVNIRNYITAGLWLFCGLFAIYIASEWAGINASLSKQLGINLPAIVFHSPDHISPTYSGREPSQSSTGSDSQPTHSGNASAADIKPSDKALAQAVKSAEKLAVVSTLATGYDRTQHFGSSWGKIEGCSVREVVLARDFSTFQHKPGSSCEVVKGTLNDPYTGRSIEFVRGPSTSKAVEIDHVVSASYAYQVGAHAWTKDQRVAFYNDLDNLLAVEGRVNSAKSDRGIADTLSASYPDSKDPLISGDGRCLFAQKYISTLSKYSLGITKSDQTSAIKTLKECRG